MKKINYEFSVIIPSRNRRDTLTQVLYALEEQTFPKSLFEVIVIDDQSTDGTAAFLQAFQKLTPMNLRCLSGRASTAGAARNRGLLIATGRRILFLDSDTIPQKDVLSLHAIWHDHFGDDTCILGHVAMSTTLEKETQGRVNDTRSKWDHQHIKELQWQDYRTANTSIAAHLCRDISGFDPHLPAAEDTEFASRLETLNVRFLFVGDIKVVHHHPLSFDGYFEKGALYGKAVAQWYKKAPGLRQLISSRYGVYAPEINLLKKLKYRLRDIFVNSMTVPMLSVCGRACRSVWFNFSDVIYKCVFRFHVRRAFSATLRNVQIQE